jgi:hypothetical protein
MSQEKEELYLRAAEGFLRGAVAPRDPAATGALPDGDDRGNSCCH